MLLRDKKRLHSCAPRHALPNSKIYMTGVWLKSSQIVYMEIPLWLRQRWKIHPPEVPYLYKSYNDAKRYLMTMKIGGKRSYSYGMFSFFFFLFSSWNIVPVLSQFSIFRNLKSYFGTKPFGEFYCDLGNLKLSQHELSQFQQLTRLLVWLPI